MTRGRLPVRRQALAALVASVALAGCLSGPTPVPTLGGVVSAPPRSPGASHGTAAPSAGTNPSPSTGVAGKPAPCPGTDRTPNASPGRQVSGSSANWSGYVAAVRKTGVTCVEGSWIEPTVTCPRTGHQAVAVWIGIDGFSASVLGVPSTQVLVQIGTQVDCQSGVASHSAWHEILPGEQNEVHEPGTIRAGDHLSARISFGGGQFTMQLSDADTAFAYALTAPAPGAPRKTAEWIVEAPATDCPGTCKPIALPKFATITFTNAHATIAGQRAAINNDSWSNVKLKMVRGGVTRTSTSKLLSGGTSFRVGFVHT
ncbi:MAG TPA: G1 family glutamic endopeptidase [Candidatus Limnocylindrales bacterium]